MARRSDICPGPPENPIYRTVLRELFPRTPAKCVTPFRRLMARRKRDAFLLALGVTLSIWITSRKTLFASIRTAWFAAASPFKGGGKGPQMMKRDASLAVSFIQVSERFAA
jgi:hypothetical protein